MSERICPKCQEQKDCKLFNKRLCKKCDSDYGKGHYKKNILKRKDEWLRKHYNITIDQYYELLETQNYLCKICNSECSSGQELSVDHDHVTKEIRGLLCKRCNLGIGFFKHNRDLLISAIKYLSKTI